MVRKLGILALLLSPLATGLASAAPCPDVTGTWNFTLQCVRVNPNTSPPPATVATFGILPLQGFITKQQACAFTGELGPPGGSFGPNSWIGVLSGTGGRTVNFNWFGANGSGELSANHQAMTFTYTFSESGEPPTACTGEGVKQ
jgi:hypothetical protein